MSLFLTLFVNLTALPHFFPDPMFTKSYPLMAQALADKRFAITLEKCMVCPVECNCLDFRESPAVYWGSFVSGVTAFASYAFKDSPSDPLGDLGDNGISEGSPSHKVQFRGNPINNSAKPIVGYPPSSSITLATNEPDPGPD